MSTDTISTKSVAEESRKGKFIPTSSQWSVMLLILSGICAISAALIGQLRVQVAAVLFLPLFLVGIAYFHLIREVIFTNIWTRFSGIFFSFILISHGLGVLLPEVGFDALWYHLPTTRTYVEQGQLVYDPRWYQTLYPQFANSLHWLGYLLAQEVGVKAVNFLALLSLLVVCYQLSRRYLTVFFSLAVVCTISLFQVVSWQASSAYVDLLSAIFFIQGFLFLFLSREKNSSAYLLSGICWGAFLSSKFINLGFLPLLGGLLLYSLWQQKKERMVLVHGLLCLMGIIALSWFWFARAYLYTYSFLYPIGSEYAVPVIHQMEKGGWREWWLYQLHQLPTLPWHFIVKNDGYLPVGVFLTLFVLLKKSRATLTWLLPALACGVYAIGFWWFFPPPSTRYVLGPLIIASLGILIVFFKTMATYRNAVQKVILLVWFLHLSLYLGVRVLIVNTRGIPYLLGRETREQYLDRFRNGFLDEKINMYYGNTPE